MNKKILTGTLRQFVFLVTLILGGGEVCFGDMVETGSGTINGSLSVLGNESVTGNLSVTGSTSLSSLNNTPIGASQPNTGSFTTLNSSGATSLGATTATSINNTSIGATTASSGKFTTLDASGAANFVSSTHTSEYAANFNARTVYTEKGIAENGDLYGFIGSGQSSLVKSGASGTILTSNGIGSMPGFQKPLTSTSSAVAYLSSNQSIPSSTVTKVALDSVAFDLNNEFDVSTNHRFIAKAAGNYLICGAIYYISNEASKILIMQVYVNGSPKLYIVNHTAVADDWNENGCMMYPLAPNDYLEMWAYHTNSTSKNIGPSGNGTQTRLSVQRLN